MDILNLYQTAFIATAIGTAVMASRAKRRMSPVQVKVVAQVSDPIPTPTPMIPAAADAIKERIRQLDKLFDENLLTVDEYVELRRRANGNQSV